MALASTSTLTPGNEILNMDKLLVRRRQVYLNSEFTISNFNEDKLFQVSHEQMNRKGWGFECDVTNMSNENVLHLERTSDISSYENITTVTSEGNLLGYVAINRQFFKLKYIITDEKEETLFIIKPKLLESNHIIFYPDKKNAVGTIKNNFFSTKSQLYFPLKLDVKSKLLILSATILIMDDQPFKDFLN